MKNLKVEVKNMKHNVIYKLRILVLEIYVRITMMGYESKQKKFEEKFGVSGSHPGQLMGVKHEQFSR